MVEGRILLGGERRANASVPESGHGVVERWRRATRGNERLADKRVLGGRSERLLHPTDIGADLHAERHGVDIHQAGVQPFDLNRLRPRFEESRFPSSGENDLAVKPIFHLRPEHHVGITNPTRLV